MTCNLSALRAEVLSSLAWAIPPWCLLDTPEKQAETFGSPGCPCIVSLQVAHIGRGNCLSCWHHNREAGKPPRSNHAD